MDDIQIDRQIDTYIHPYIHTYMTYTHSYILINKGRLNIEKKGKWKDR